MRLVPLSGKNDLKLGKGGRLRLCLLKTRRRHSARPGRKDTVSDICEPGRVADYLLVESRERGEVLTNLKLQKLLYYAQAWFLALHDGPLFKEDFRAWVHGPVLPSQYRRFRHNQWRPILDEVTPPTQIEPRVEAHLDEILDVFGSEPATALEIMTHRERPWLEARGDTAPDEPSNAIVRKKTMQDFYRSL